MSKALQVRHVGSWLATGSETGYKLTFATFLIVAALGFTYGGSDGNFPSFELGGVLVRVLAFSGVLLAVALLLPRGRGVSNAALALATLAGIFTSYVVHTELFYPPNRVGMVMVLAASYFGLFTAFRVIDETNWGGITLAVAAAAAVSVAAWPSVVPRLVDGLKAPGGLLYVGNPIMWVVPALTCVGGALGLYLLFRAVHPSRTGWIAFVGAGCFVTMLVLVLGQLGEGGGGDYNDGWEDHPNVRSVAFKETPNIYFVGFDSITPEAIMRKHMGIETTRFHQLMERDMRRFRNLFSIGANTKASFNMLMALDQDIYLGNWERRLRRPSYFAGHDLGPLIWLLRLNGYETTSIYQGTWFGRTPGPHIDNYVINTTTGLCSLLDADVRVLALWGYCWGWAAEGDEEGRLPAGDFLVQELSSVGGGSPQFVIAHLYLPGHTPMNFDHRNEGERRRFLVDFERDFNSAATYLEQIVEHLRADDPDAILFVFGDHGAQLSRRVDVEDDPTFFLQDRFAILGGVYPRDRCAPELDEAERKGYTTTLDVVHAIIECLSDGQSPILEPRRDRFWVYSILEDHSYDYEEFLYE